MTSYNKGPHGAQGPGPLGPWDLSRPEKVLSSRVLRTLAFRQSIGAVGDLWGIHWRKKKSSRPDPLTEKIINPKPEFPIDCFFVNDCFFFSPMIDLFPVDGSNFSVKDCSSSTFQNQAPFGACWTVRGEPTAKSQDFGARDDTKRGGAAPPPLFFVLCFFRPF